MNIHMMKRTTLVLDEHNFAELKSLAASQRRTLSELVNEILQAGLRQVRNKRRPKRPFRMPTFDLGPARVDISNREELYRVMEGR